MSKTKSVRQKVREKREFYEGISFGELKQLVEKFSADWNVLIDDVKIDAEGETSWDSTYATVTLFMYVMRDENDGEYTARLERETKWKEDTEKRERALLDSLKAKYK